MTAPRELDEFEQRILQNVQDHGCQVNYVFDPDGEKPGFSYSIGFPETVDQPEVIIFGLDHELMHKMVNLTLGLCRSGLVLADWTPVRGLLEEFDCIARAVLLDNVAPDYFSSALWYHRYRTGSDLERATQIVWPGAADGLFPWNEGSDDLVRDSQPALYDKKLIS